MNTRFSSLTLTDNEQLAIQILMQAMLNTLQENLIRMVIYGSKARSDFNSDSDIDIFVLVKKISRKQRKQIYETILDLELEYDTRISLVFYSGLEYQENIQMKSFLWNILKKRGWKFGRTKACVKSVPSQRCCGKT
ncbi:MAG: nucleotidyltransferase domain-containing protein [Peptococcaceae bacterium]|nr:nucleotidyltransferase domain-containing protein [Peptococcaceae bacterium]